MKFAKTAVLALALVMLAQVAAYAQPEATAPAGGAAVKAPFSELRGIGVGLVIIGAAMGIGGLTKSAVESMARQPETAANVQTAMIISAALIEGVTFFALIIIGFILTA
jgi:F-type H+-transporting ATPase subunit c